MVQLGQFLGRLLGPLLGNGLPLIVNVLKPLAKSVLVPFGLTTAASARDSYSKENFWIQHKNTSILKWKLGSYHENSWIFSRVTIIDRG